MITILPARSFIAPVLGFALILLTMNGYQYFKLKQRYTRELVNEVATTELGELQSVFNDIEETLLLIRDWCDESNLARMINDGLVEKLVPVLNRLDYISGIILANSNGEEYFLYRSDKKYLARTTSPEENVIMQHFSEWNSNLEKLQEWEKAVTYDPRTRPWFIENITKKSVHWTDVYHFFSNDKKGITASVSWTTDENGSEHFVLGMDVSLDMIKTILDARKEQRPGILFLTRANDNGLVGDEETYLANTPDTLSKNAPLKQIISHWKNEGTPSKVLLTVKIDGSKWYSSFQRVDHKNSKFWIGLAANPQELEDWFDDSFLRIDLVETIIALCGSALILLLMRHGGLLSNKFSAEKSPEERLLSCLDLGEGSSVEFKSTIRTNLKTGKPGKEIELAWLKAAVAFLNTDGGTVLLGIDDCGGLIGLAADNFENTDKTMLHVKNLLNHHIGPEFSSFFEISPVSFDGKLVVMLQCKPASDAVFLKIGKNEEFYIRSGPSSTKLSPSQIISYIKKGKN